MVVHLMYMIPRELFNIGGYQDKEHVDQTLQGKREGNKLGT